MGLIQKKDEKEELDGIEIIGRGEGPDGLEDYTVELHDGATAEDISGTSAEREGELELEADPELLQDVDEQAEETEEEADAEVAEDEVQADDVDIASTSACCAKGSAACAKRRRLAVVGAAAAVIIAAVIGYFIGTGGFDSKGATTAFLTEDQLDTVVATWNYNGAKHKVTAREAIESQYGLDAVKTVDDTYPVPAADAILAMVRNEVLLAEAKKQGISVDDKELSAAAEDSLGTSDFEQIAQQYGLSKDQAKDIVRQQAILKKLYNSVVKDAPIAPVAPAEPAEGAEAEATPEYADYIKQLAGDAWDAKAGAWKDAKSDFAQALPADSFNGEQATYEQAQTAYFVAYQAFSAQNASSTEQWTAFVNKLFASTNLQLFGIFA